MTGSEDSWPLVIGWVIVILASIVGTTMVVVGMIEEVPGIVTAAFRSFVKPRT